MQTTKHHSPIKTVLLLTALCVALTVTRIIIQQNIYYTFLVFNLFLAWVPYLLTRYFFQKENIPKAKIAAVYVLWVLFFPNAPYIITDLLHFKEYSHGILWFDSLLVFTYAVTGLLLGAYSLQKAHFKFNRIYGGKIAYTVVVILLLLSGFAIYLGRYCRINSWDIFKQPIWFIERVFHQFENPLTYKVTFTYGLVLLALYSVFYQVSNKPNEGFS